jgi:hypothetical protein
MSLVYYVYEILIGKLSYTLKVEFTEQLIYILYVLESTSMCLIILYIWGLGKYMSIIYLILFFSLCDIFLKRS